MYLYLRIWILHLYCRGNACGKDALNIPITCTECKKDPIFGPDPEWFRGADGRIRTAYLLITNQLLYQLSYAGQTSSVVADNTFNSDP